MAPRPSADYVHRSMEALHGIGRDDLMQTVAESMRPGEGAALGAAHLRGHFPDAPVTGHSPGDWARVVLHFIDDGQWEVADAVFGRPVESCDVAGLEAFTGTNRQRFVEQRSDSNVARAWQQENARHVRATTPELAQLGYTGLDWDNDILGFAAEYLGSCQGKDLYHDGEAHSGRLIAWDVDCGQGTVLAPGITAAAARRAVERAQSLLDRKASLYDVRALATAPSAQADAAPSM